MGEINIANQAGRDALVNTRSVRAQIHVRWLDAENRQAQNVRLLKSTLECDVDALSQQFGSLKAVGQALLDGDPEVDSESTGSLLRDTSRVFVDPDRRIVHRVYRWEVVKTPDGEVRERRPRVIQPPNVTADVPLSWSGKMIKKSEACRRFVFANKMQLVHINGLTYDFLFGMAKELEERDSLMLLGAGPKGNQPLILRRGSTAYRGFLEGRTDGERYCLLLHMSNLEYKRPQS